MCLAQGPQRSDAGEAQPAALWSQVKHSTTETLRSPSYTNNHHLLDVHYHTSYILKQTVHEWQPGQMPPI